MADGTSGGSGTGSDSGSSATAAPSRPRPGAKRPTGEKPAPATSTTSARPVRKPTRNRLTGRAGILALTLCAVMVTVAYPLRQYLAQRSQISNLKHQNDGTAKQVASLQTELTKWNDPAYVAIQARELLHYVRPGETGFLVPNPSASPEPLGIPTPTAQAWYDRLWGTVKSPQPSAPAQSQPSPSASPAPTK